MRNDSSTCVLAMFSVLAPGLELRIANFGNHSAHWPDGNSSVDSDTIYGD